MYGVLVALAITVARILGPVGWLLFWVVVACQSGFGAALVWRRTGLPLMTAGLAGAACVSAIFAVGTGIGDTWEALLFRHPVLVIGSVACTSLLMFAERWAHPNVWRRMKEQSDRSTVGDILRFRHIPDLRSSSDA